MSDAGRERVTDLREDICQSFDHTAPEFAARKLELLAHLREHCPVSHSDQHGGFWVLSRYRDITMAAANTDVFSSAQTVVGDDGEVVCDEGGSTFPFMGHLLPGLPAECDPPLHTSLRRVITPFLTPGAIRDFEPNVQSTVSMLIDSFIPDGRADLVHQFARHIPVLTLAELMQFSPDESRKVRDWAYAMLDGAGGGDVMDMLAAVEGYFGFLRELVEEGRRGQPRRGMIEAILGANIGGRTLTDEECMGMLFTVTLGAVDTTAGAIAHGLHLLCRFPEVRERLLREPELWPAAVEEILRMEAPGQALARTVRREFEIDGKVLRPGERVLLFWASGNYDERRFERPDAFILDRPSNAHLSFGHGVHKCAGMHVARMEVRVALQEIVQRIPDYQLEGPVTPKVSGGIAWGLDAFPVTFSPVAMVGTP